MVHANTLKAARVPLSAEIYRSFAVNELVMRTPILQAGAML
jgi:hypothetical protein